MEEELVKTAADKEKARSLLKMAETTYEMAKTIDPEKYPSNVIREYYEVIRELVSASLLIDGYKTYGEGAHRKAIEYIGRSVEGFTEHERHTMDELRKVRNRMAYEGFFLQQDYLKRKEETIDSIISKLRKNIRSRLD